MLFDRYITILYYYTILSYTILIGLCENLLLNALIHGVSVICVAWFIHMHSCVLKWDSMIATMLLSACVCL